MRTSHARYRKLRRGQTIDVGDGVTVQVLSPSEVSYSDLNDESLVLRLVYKNTAILVDGDATKLSEDDVLASKMNVRAQVLDVGHHGSKDATSSEWLAAVRPSIAVISCAAHSRYGFPSRQVRPALLVRRQDLCHRRVRCCHRHH